MANSNYKVIKSLQAPGKHLCGLGWDKEALWHSDGDTNQIYKLDPNSGEVLLQIDIDNVKTDLDVDEKEIWQVGGDTKQIYVIDKQSGVLTHKIPFEDNPANACAIYLANESYMIGYKDTGKIEQRNRSNNEVVSEIQGLPEIGGIGILNNILWYSVYQPGKIIGIDKRTSEILYEFEIDGNPTGLCTDDEKVWYSDYTNYKIVAITPANE